MDGARLFLANFSKSRMKMKNNAPQTSLYLQKPSKEKLQYFGFRVYITQNKTRFTVI